MNNAYNPRSTDEGITDTQCDYILSRVLDILNDELPEDLELSELCTRQLGELLREEVNSERDMAFEVGEQVGYERGDEGARDDMDLAASQLGDMAAAWAHRFRQAGSRLTVSNAADEGRITLTVDEQEAWDMLSKFA